MVWFTLSTWFCNQNQRFYTHWFICIYSNIMMTFHVLSISVSCSSIPVLLVAATKIKIFFLLCSLIYIKPDVHSHLNCKNPWGTGRSAIPYHTIPNHVQVWGVRGCAAWGTGRSAGGWSLAGCWTLGTTWPWPSTPRPGGGRSWSVQYYNYIHTV